MQQVNSAAAPATFEVIESRYVLMARLGQGGMGTVYRALDRLTDTVVALKRVSIPHDRLDFASRPNLAVTQSSEEIRLALAQEFRLLASLRHPHIISVLDYGFDASGQPYFTMDYLEDARTILEAGQGQSTEHCLRLLAQTLQALAYLHRRGILHRDLKPENVLVTHAGVRVLDFGLAVAFDRLTESGRIKSGEVAGTLTYLAPEVLQGAAPTRASDAYAIGMLAYELLTGEYPFNQMDINELLMSILTTPPDVTRLGDNAEAQLVMQHLLSKSPRERFGGDVDTILNRLIEAYDVPIPAEPEAVRESFLTAAQFVGREAELAVLEEALNQAITGSGSGWLVGGESGVGKTRLLNELRALALVRGVLVLRGQAVSDSAGLPYQLWREPLRRLALATELSDLEAGVLKAVVPDIARLLGRPVPDAPPLDGEAGQQRLLLTIADVFRRQKRPVLLLLEDLQWSTKSLDVLRQHLLRSVPDLPLLVIGSYRDDERADLPEQLPGMQVLKLQRFDEPTVAALSMSMLGATGSRPDVVDLLQRETEGNVFFLIEVVRTLAEDAGRLSDVGTITLPHTLVVGGMLEIIRRRLEQVPPEYRPLLRLAAVSGRQQDLRLLALLEPAQNLERWLSACAAAAVLEVVNGGWQFSHDKLREGVLNDLSTDERPALHRRVAEALETLYPETSQRASTLAYHWQMAQEPAKERHYRQIAGEQLLTGAYYRQALTEFDRVGHLLPASDRLAQARLQCQMAECLTMLSEYPAASLLLDEALAVVETEPDDALRAVVLHKKGSIADFLGDFEQAVQYEQASVELYRRLNLQEALADGLRTLGTTLYQQGRVEEALRCHEEGRDIYASLGHQLKVAQSLNNIANLIGSQGDFTTAREFLETCIGILKAHGDRKGVANCANNIGVMAANQDDFAAARRYYQEALDLSKEIGNRQSVIIGLYNLGETAELQHDIAAAGQYYREGLQQAVALQSVSLKTAFLTGTARLMIPDGKLTEAAETFGMLLEHPGMIHEVKEQLKPTLDTLRASLGDPAYEAALQRGAALDLDDLIQQLLHPDTPTDTQTAETPAASDLVETQTSETPVAASSTVSREQPSRERASDERASNERVSDEDPTTPGV